MTAVIAGADLPDLVVRAAAAALGRPVEQIRDRGLGPNLSAMFMLDRTTAELEALAARVNGEDTCSESGGACSAPQRSP